MHISAAFSAVVALGLHFQLQCYLQCIGKCFFFFFCFLFLYFFFFLKGLLGPVSIVGLRLVLGC